MRVFSCVWKINFPENIFSWPCVLIALTRKWFEVKIFTSNHFRTHMQREREKERESPILRPSSSPTTTAAHSSDQAPIRWPILSIAAPRRSSKDRLQHHSISPPSVYIASRSNPVASLSSFFSQFDRIWWIFFSRFCFFCVSVLTGFDEFFFWVLFLLYFCIDRIWWIFFLGFVSFVFLYWGMILYICLAVEKMWENVSNK